MPTSGMSNSNDLIYQRACHRRDKSDELCVFEAARYFSGGMDGVGLGVGRFSGGVEGRNCTLGFVIQSPFHWQAQGIKKLIKEDEKEKKKMTGRQQVSPGKRLANLLNLFLQQSGLKKKPSRIKGCKKEEISMSGRLSSKVSSSDAARSCRESQSFSSSVTLGYHFIGTSSDYLREPNQESGAFVPQYDVIGERKADEGAEHRDFLSEKEGVILVKELLERDVLVYCKDGSAAVEKWTLNKNNDGVVEMLWGNGPRRTKQRSFWSEVEDDGEESDCSSDLFDLPKSQL